MADRNGVSVADEKLIKNLENQLDRLVEQLKDLEDCKDDLTEEEYNSSKEETLEQIKEFTATLDRLNKGDVTLTSQFSSMRAAIREAISKAFKTIDMIQMFGDQNELATQLVSLEEAYQLKKIPLDEYEVMKLRILFKLNQQGHCLSTVDKQFLEAKSNSDILQGMESVEDDN